MHSTGIIDVIRHIKQDSVRADSNPPCEPPHILVTVVVPSVRCTGSKELNAVPKLSVGIAHHEKHYTGSRCQEALEASEERILDVGVRDREWAH